MKTRYWYIIVVTLCAIGIALLAIRAFAPGNKLPFYSTLSDNPELTKLRYTNQSGSEVTMNAYSGRVMVVDFIFTHCPTICPEMTANMREIQKAHSGAEDLQFLSFSVDRTRFDPQGFFDFAGLFDADTTNWHFLTGDKKDIYRIARTGFTVTAMEGDGGPDDFIHSPIMVLLDRKTNLRGFYDGTDTVRRQEIDKRH